MTFIAMYEEQFYDLSSGFVTPMNWIKENGSWHDNFINNVGSSNLGDYEFEDDFFIMAFKDGSVIKAPVADVKFIHDLQDLFLL